MNKVILAGVAAITLLGSGAVYAQHRHHHRHHHHHRISAEDKAAFVDARIAAVKAGLRLTPDQEKMWPPVETAVRDFAKQRIDRANARATERDARRATREQAQKDGKATPDQATPNRAPDQLARLRDRADVMAANATSLKHIADAADPLYKSLNDGQKRRLAVLIRIGGRFGHGGGREFGREFGPGNRGGHEGWHNRDDRDHRGPRDGQSERL